MTTHGLRGKRSYYGSQPTQFINVVIIKCNSQLVPGLVFVSPNQCYYRHKTFHTCTWRDVSLQGSCCCIAINVPKTYYAWTSKHVCGNIITDNMYTDMYFVVNIIDSWRKLIILRLKFNLTMVQTINVLKLAVIKLNVLKSYLLDLLFCNEGYPCVLNKSVQLHVNVELEPACISMSVLYNYL